MQCPGMQNTQTHGRWDGVLAFYQVSRRYFRSQHPLPEWLQVQPCVHTWTWTQDTPAPRAFQPPGRRGGVKTERPSTSMGDWTRSNQGPSDLSQRNWESPCSRAKVMTSPSPQHEAVWGWDRAGGQRTVSFGSTGSLVHWGRAPAPCAIRSDLFLLCMFL